MSFRRILIAVDDQPIAEHAAKVGVELAHALAAEVALVTVIDISTDYAAGVTVAGRSCSSS